MSDNLRLFTQAVYAFDAVVRRTADDQWSAATPCEGWDARDLLQHQCAVLNGVAAMAASDVYKRQGIHSLREETEVVRHDGSL